MLEIHYFASVREAMQRSKQQLSLPEATMTVGGLVELLSRQNACFKNVYESGKPLLVAVNQTMVDSTHPVCDGDEVAFFPPMTGG